MPKIERQTQKIFAGQANSDELGAFGTMKYTQTSGGSPVYSSDIEILQSNPAYEQGWSVAVLADKAPFLEEMNGVQYGFSKQIAYLLQTGMPEYNPDTTYYTNSFCQVNGIIYKSLTDENIGNDPTADTTNWEEFSAGGSGSSLPIGTMFFSSGYVDTTKGLVTKADGSILSNNANTKAFIDWVVQSAALNSDFATTEQNWQAEAALSPDGVCGKYVINYGTDNEVTSVRLPKMPDYLSNDYNFNSEYNLPVVGNGITVGLTNGNQEFGLRMGYITNTSNDVLNGSETLFGSPIGTKGAYTDITDSLSIGFSLKPDKSGARVYLNDIASKSTKVKGSWYIQIATGAETINNIKNEFQSLNPYHLFEPVYSDTPLYDAALAGAQAVVTKAVYPDFYSACLIELNPDIKVGTLVNVSDTFSWTKLGKPVKASGASDITDYHFVVDTTAETVTMAKKYRYSPVNSEKDIPVIGDGTTLGLTNGTQNIGIHMSNFSGTGSGLGASLNDYGTLIGSANSSGSGVKNNLTYGVTNDPEKSGLKGLLSNAASGGFLYFRVANTIQNAAIMNAGRIEEGLDNKQDKLVRYPIEVSDPSLMPSWYVVYNDGWCEQGGKIPTANPTTVQLLKSYKDTNYACLSGGGNAKGEWPWITLLNTNSIQVGARGTTGIASGNVAWNTFGYLAQGEY